VAITVWKLFWGYGKRVEEMGKTFQKQIRESKQEGMVIILLLSIGMFLQGLAIFVD
jgi:hypothetical protein